MWSISGTPLEEFYIFTINNTPLCTLCFVICHLNLLWWQNKMFQLDVFLEITVRLVPFNDSSQWCRHPCLLFCTIQFWSPNLLIWSWSLLRTLCTSCRLHSPPCLCLWLTLLWALSSTLHIPGREAFLAFLNTTCACTLYNTNPYLQNQPSKSC